VFELNKVGAIQVMEHDEVHGVEDGHKMLMNKCSTWKRRKRKTKTRLITAKVSNRFLFCTQDTIKGVSDLGSIAVYKSIFSRLSKPTTYPIFG
jgi:hypothetical protein